MSGFRYRPPLSFGRAWALSVVSDADRDRLTATFGTLTPNVVASIRLAAAAYRQARSEPTVGAKKRTRNADRIRRLARIEFARTGTLTKTRLLLDRATVGERIALLPRRLLIGPPGAVRGVAGFLDHSSLSDEQLHWLQTGATSKARAGRSRDVDRDLFLGGCLGRVSQEFAVVLDLTAVRTDRLGRPGEHRRPTDAQSIAAVLLRTAGCGPAGQNQAADLVRAARRYLAELAAASAARARLPIAIDREAQADAVAYAHEQRLRLLALISRPISTGIDGQHG